MIWILVAYLPGLWLYSVPLTGDQKVYLSTAMEMWQQGEWIYPIIHGAHNYFKPPFLYWVLMSSWSIFGYNMFATLFPFVLATFLTAYFISEISILFGFKKKNLTVGLWFASSMGALTYGTSAQMEIYIACLYAGAWWGGVKFVHTKNSRWIYAGLIMAGLLGLVKSPLYSFLWGFGYIIFVYFSRSHWVFRRAHTYLAIFTGLVVGGAWFGYIALTDFQQFYDDYYVRESLMKKGGNGLAPWHLWWALIYFSIPFVFFSMPAISAYIRRVVPNQKTLVCFLLGWSALPFLFFSYFPYRVHTYFFILVPAFALFIEWGVQSLRDRNGSDQSKNFYPSTLRVTGAVLAIVTLAVGGFVIWTKLVPAWVGLGFLLMMVGFVYCSIRLRWKELAVLSLGLLLFSRLGGVALGEEELSPLRRLIGSQEKVAFFDYHRFIWHETSILSPAVSRLGQRLYNAESAAQAIIDGSYLILSDEENREFGDRIRAQFEIRRTKNQMLQTLKWPRWKKRRDLDLAQVFFSGRTDPDTWRELTKRDYEVLYAASSEQ